MNRPGPLQPPDSIHLEAALGWLELGNYPESNEELEKITASLRSHPDVLEVRWQIYAKFKKWEWIGRGFGQKDLERRRANLRKSEGESTRKA